MVLLPVPGLGELVELPREVFQAHLRLRLSGGSSKLGPRHGCFSASAAPRHGAEEEDDGFNRGQ